MYLVFSVSMFYAIFSRKRTHYDLKKKLFITYLKFECNWASCVLFASSGKISRGIVRIKWHDPKGCQGHAYSRHSVAALIKQQETTDTI